MNSFYLGENKYIYKRNEDGTVTAECEKTTDGFHVIITFTNNREDHMNTLMAMRRLYDSVI
ncbi:hypothetical protein EDM57_04195 [Brevibacillus gelatini]|uniref:Uncharacterized protein n=1 Tax=Brevibacillus gelatini TaxID=1655277 RepID=A0A3M8B7J8_9BACL|nr:hypothetical protein [Brevibacillus gelatini]RNB59349.1 hypothetical protein EDM57_04195 [Brevibacillus gelatini]